MKKNNVILLLFVIIFSTSFVVAGCATIPKEADLKESLKKTAEKYWKMRMGDRYEETYKMEYEEGKIPFKDYLQKAMAIKKFTNISYSIKDVTLEGSKGLVDIEFSFIIPPVTKPLKQEIKEIWIYQDGEWRHQLNPE